MPQQGHCFFDASEHGQNDTPSISEVGPGSFERPLVLAKHEVRVHHARGNQGVQTAGFLMGHERRLQQPAIAAHMRKPGKEFRIAPSLTGPVEEPLHCIQRAALVHLNVRIEIVSQRQIRIQAERRLKRFFGSAQPLE